MSQRYYNEKIYPIEYKYICKMILITGTTGLVGTHLLAHLFLKDENAKHIIGVYRSEDKKNFTLKVIFEVYGVQLAKQAEQIHWKKGDICDLPFLEGVFSDVNEVYHCAGIISNAPSREKELRKVNIEGTAHLINLSIANNIDKFCHLSSIASLGEAPRNELINEEHYREEQGKTSLYSISKYGGEMEVWRGTQEGLKAVIINPGVIIGEGFYTSGSGELIDKANKGFPIYVDKITGFVDVKDVVSAMYIALNSTITNERFILVAENRRLKDIQVELAEKLGKKKPYISLQKWMLVLLISVEYILSLFKLTSRKLSYTVVNDVLKNSFYDSEKSVRQLKIKYTSVTKSLDRVAKHYLSNK